MTFKRGPRFFINLLIGVGVIAASHWLRTTPFGEGAVNSYSDKIIYNDAVEAVDQYLADLAVPDQATAPSSGPAMRFLDIDDDAHAEWGQPLLTPRDKLADIVRTAAEAEVKVLVLDLLLDRPSGDPAADQALADALADLTTSGSDMRVILSAPVTNGRATPPFYANLLAICPNCRSGAAEVLANSSDRIIRFLNYYRLQKEPQGQNRIIWSIPFLATSLYYDAENRLPALEERIAKEIERVGPDQVSLELPKPWKPEETLLIDAGGSVTDRIRFRLAPPGLFRAKGRSNLLLGERFSYKQLSFAADDLKGSILMVGNSYESGGDQHVTPVGLMAGLYVLGNSVNTLAGGYQFQAVPSALLWSVEIMSLIAFAYWLPLKRSSLQALTSLALFVVQLAVYFTLMRWNIFIDNTFMFFGASIYLFVISVLDDIIDFFKWLFGRLPKCEP